HERIQRLISEADSARSALAESIPEGHMLSALRQLVLDGSALRDELVTVRQTMLNESTSATETLRALAGEATKVITPDRDAARADWHTYHQQLTVLANQTKASAQAMRQYAAGALTEAQAASAELRQHSEALVEQTQSEAAKLCQHAAAALTEAER